MEKSDFFDRLKRKIAQLTREKPEDIALDDQELREREEAARAYSKEDEAHFIAYGNDCVDTSVKANAELRKAQKECYAVYKEEAAG